MYLQAITHFNRSVTLKGYSSGGFSIKDLAVWIAEGLYLGLAYGKLSADIASCLPFHSFIIREVSIFFAAIRIGMTQSDSVFLFCSGFAFVSRAYQSYREKLPMGVYRRNAVNGTQV